MNRHAAILLALSLTFAGPSFGQVPQDSTKHAGAYETLDQLKAIIHGVEFANVRRYIAPEAYIVSGTTYTSLGDVLQSKDREAILHENASRQVAQMTARSNEAEDAMFVVMKTGSKRNTDVHYHTIVLYRKPGGDWQIHHWHVGA